MLLGYPIKKPNETGGGVDCGHMTVQSYILWMKPLEFLRLRLEIRNKSNLRPQELYKIVSSSPMMPYVNDATAAGTYRFYVPMIEDGLIIIK